MEEDLFTEEDLAYLENGGLDEIDLLYIYAENDYRSKKARGKDSILLPLQNRGNNARAYNPDKQKEYMRNMKSIVDNGGHQKESSKWLDDWKKYFRLSVRRISHSC